MWRVILSRGRPWLSGATGNGAFTIQNGASLDGLGTVGNLTAQSGGTITPGNSISTLLNIGNFAHQSGAHLSLEIGGTTAGAASNGYDQISVTGGIALAGDLQGTLLNSFLPNPGSLFFLIANDGTDAIGGTFAALPQGSLLSFGGANFAISYTGDSAGGTFTGGNDVVLMAVPEPGILANIGAGLAFIMACGRSVPRGRTHRGLSAAV